MRTIYIKPLTLTESAALTYFDFDRNIRTKNTAMPTINTMVKSDRIPIQFPNNKSIHKLIINSQTVYKNRIF